MNYDEWNKAIIRHIVGHQEPGALVYLDVDETVLRQIALSTGETSNSLSDFQFAVQQAVVTDSPDGEHQLDVSQLYQPNADGEPRCVAFLTLMVLAASRMARTNTDDTNRSIRASNFFYHFRKLLDLEPTDGPRPKGFSRDDDETLWKTWGQFVRRAGLQPTAKPGKGSHEYIEYPISQTLLRDADKERLRVLFTSKSVFRTPMAPDRLMLRVLKDVEYFTKHAQEMLRSQRRFEAISDAVYSVYESWLFSHDSVSDDARTGYLHAGLHRTTDPFRGSVQYRFYPRLGRYELAPNTTLAIGNDDRIHLYLERARYLMPFGGVTAEHMGQGCAFPLDPPTPYSFVSFAKRNIHVLVPDPTDISNGVYATWGSPSPSLPFVIVCEVSMREKLQRIRDARLIAWDGEPKPLFGGETWWEYLDCMTLADDWTAFRVTDRELYDALRPKRRLYMGLSGGLRFVRADHWMAGFGPTVTIYGIGSSVQLRIRSLGDDRSVHERDVDLNSEAPIPREVWQCPGWYQIEAGDTSDPEVRSLQIVDWNELRLSNSPVQYVLKIDGASVRGPRIEPCAESSDDTLV